MTEEGEIVPRGEVERMAAEREAGQVEEAEAVENPSPESPAPLDARGMADDFVEDVLRSKPIRKTNVCLQSTKSNKITANEIK